MTDKPKFLPHLADYANPDKSDADTNPYATDGDVYHDSATNMLTYLLGFCGCGLPEDALSYVLAGLRLIDERPSNPQHTRAEWDDWYDGHVKREKSVFGEYPGAGHFFYYWADAHKLAEHGGSVPGWLTEDGKAMLSLLTEWEVGRG